ncbi:glycosyltransferase family 9 protein [Cryobacterium tepidiphilum]|jgi:ADP-heptose:LPS heptosyltransferase|nr:glycosyltransferase family 9 protein [Cryobacterium tepidiphilum]
MQLPPTGDDRPVVLALRALKLGDLLVAVPALHAIKRARPDHRLVYAAPGWLRPIVSLVDSVDDLLPTPGLDDPLDLEPGSVETVVNLHGNGPESRGALERLRAPVRLGHHAPGWDGPEWLDGIHERDRWARLVSAHGMPADPLDMRLRVPAVRPVVPNATVVHVGAFYGSRQWPVTRFAEVARALTEDGQRVVFTGSAAEAARAREVAALSGLPDETVLAGRLELDGFASLIAAAALVVSADTGAAHLASAYRVPSVVLFGPAPVEEWGPPADGPHIVLTDATLRRGDTFGSEPDPAILAVTPADVVSAARSLASRPV